MSDVENIVTAMSEIAEEAEEVNIGLSSNIGEAAGVSTVSSSQQLSRLARFILWFAKRTYRKKKFMDFMSKLMMLAYGAKALKENTVSCIIHTPSGDFQFSTEYNPYDVLEFLTMNEVLTDKRMRREFVDTVVEMIGSTRIHDGEKIVTVKEYVESQGLSWEKVAEKIRGKIEASISNYLYELSNTRGSLLAKHIYLRNKARQMGVTGVWMYAFFQNMSLALASIYAKKRVASLVKPLQMLPEKIASIPGKEHLMFYNYLLRSGKAVEDLAMEHIGFAKTKSLSNKIRAKIRLLDSEKAFEEFKKISEEFAEKTHEIVEIVPGDIVKMYLSAPVSKDEIDRFVQRGKRVREKTGDEEEEINIKI